MYFAISDTGKYSQVQSFLPPYDDKTLKNLRKRDEGLRSFGGIGLSVLAKTQKPLDERLYDARACCKIKMSEVSRYLSDEWRKGLYCQLDNLMDIENWEEDDDPITSESFTTFLRLITFLKPARRPGIAATSNGHIIAAWTEETARLTIECQENDKSRWVVSHVVDGVRESGAGVSSLIRLPAVLSPYNPDRWFGNDAKKEHITTRY